MNSSEKVTALDLEMVDPLPEATKKYFDICQEKLGMIPNVLKAYDDKYHVYDYEFGSYIRDNNDRKRRGIFYAIIIGFVFIASHYVAANYSEEPAGFYPPYIEKRVVYPELYKEK